MIKLNNYTLSVDSLTIIRQQQLIYDLSDFMLKTKINI